MTTPPGPERTRRRRPYEPQPLPASVTPITYEERPPLWRLVGVIGLLVLPLVLGLGLALWEGPVQADEDLLEEDLFSEAEEGWSDPVGAELPLPTPATRVSVTSDPAGAVVLIDLDSVGQTPLYAFELSPGPHIISIRGEGRAPVDTILFVEGGRPTHLSFPLVDASGAPGPERELAGGALPRAEVLVPERAGGPQREARIEALSPSPRAGAPVRSSPSASQTEEETAATGRLYVTSEPSGAIVWVGIRAVGTTPVTVPSIPSGDYRITVLHREGGERYVTNVQVEPGATARVHGQLRRPRMGTLAVLVRPWGSIYIDGQLHKQDAAVQYETQLLAGRHRVRVVHPVLGTQEREVEITAGAPLRLVIDLR